MKATVGQTLKQARKALGLTQQQLAARMGVKPAYVAGLESDKWRPSLGLLSRLAPALDLEPKKLFLLAYPEARSLISAKPRRRPRDHAWRAFVKNKRLLARHNVRPHELTVLAQTNSLGQVVAPSDFLFILNSIRQAADPEE
jgi:transcriptional regulator with XRE-family HTH domain